MPDPADGATSGGRAAGFHIRDLAGLVLGYSLAAFLLRSFRHLDAASAAEMVALAAFYLWLGLAASGPFVLLMEPRGPAPAGAVPTTDPPSRFAPEEMAWMGIGGYFVAIALFVVPATHRATPWDAIVIVQALVAVSFLIWIATRRRAARPPARADRWTRRAAVLLLWTWPIAWLLLILLVR